MDKNNLNISKVETYLNQLLDNKVSRNTFFGSIPEKETLDLAWQDMVFVDFPDGLLDYDSYGMGRVLIWLYAKPLSSGRKNVATLSKMEQKLNDILDSTRNDTYNLTRRRVTAEYDKVIDWHCNAVEVIIKVF